MIAIIDSGGYNLASIENSLLRLDKKPVVTKDPSAISKADHVILPGVGAAEAAMDELRERDLLACLRSLTQPVLGICLGMQLLFDHSAEGDVPLLGLIPGEVSYLEAEDLVVPHMGWNTIDFVKTEHLLFKGVPGDAHFYFVHSYGAPVNDASLATATYGAQFAAVVARDNYFGTQFHPEKSSQVGQRVLKNFLNL